MATFRERIAREVNDLLMNSRHYTRRGESYNAINAVYQAIVNGLSRGERVKVAGFGIFEVRTRKAHKHRVTYFNGEHNHHDGYTTMADVPETKYVHFSPSKVLLRLLNDDPRPGE